MPVRQIFPFVEEILQFPSFYGKGHFSLCPVKVHKSDHWELFLSKFALYFYQKIFYFWRKICHVGNFTETYLPQINGVVTHIKILKEGLEALGHTVLIVTADSKAHTHYLKDNVLHCPAHNLKRIYNLDLASPVSRTRLKYLREFRPDIIHVHNEFSIGLSGMANLPKSSRCRWCTPCTPCTMTTSTTSHQSL